MIDDEQLGPPCSSEMCPSATVPPTFRDPISTAWLLSSPPTVAHANLIAPVLGFIKWRVCDMPAWHPIHGSGGHPRSRFGGQEPPITPATRFQKTSDEPHRHILAVVILSFPGFSRAGRNQLLRTRKHDLEVWPNKSGNGRKFSSNTRRCRRRPRRPQVREDAVTT